MDLNFRSWRERVVAVLGAILFTGVWWAVVAALPRPILLAIPAVAPWVFLGGLALLGLLYVVGLALARR